jgi:hypothetical protein
MALAANIRLWWTLAVVESTSAYYDITTITAIKSFIAQAIDFYRIDTGSWPWPWPQILDYCGSK